LLSLLTQTALSDLVTIPSDKVGRGGDGAYALNGHTLATATNEWTVLLWEVADPARPRRLGDPLTGHTNRVVAVAFAPD
jgi:hypothetical protein